MAFVGDNFGAYHVELGHAKLKNTLMVEADKRILC